RSEPRQPGGPVRRRHFGILRLAIRRGERRVARPGESGGRADERRGPRDEFGGVTMEAPSARSDGRYAKEVLAGWGTMDCNGHMANTAYLDPAADVRMAFFAEHGFPPVEFRRLAIGPVMQKDELEYFREVGLHDAVTVTYALLAMSADGSRFVIENEIWLASGERAGRVRSTGGWLDLRERKLVAPPPALFDTFARVPRAPDFRELPSARRK